MTLDDLGIRLTLRALASFISYLEPSSATHKALSGKEDEWDMTTHMLAGIYDQLTFLRYEQACLHQKRKPKKPECLKRPGEKEKRIGKDPIAIKDFDSWWEGG